MIPKWFVSLFVGVVTLGAPWAAYVTVQLEVIKSRVEAAATAADFQILSSQVERNSRDISKHHP